MKRRKNAGREITKSEFHDNISQLILLMKILEDTDDNVHNTKSNECIPFALNCGDGRGTF